MKKRIITQALMLAAALALTAGNAGAQAQEVRAQAAAEQTQAAERFGMEETGAQAEAIRTPAVVGAQAGSTEIQAEAGRAKAAESAGMQTAGCAGTQTQAAESAGMQTAAEKQTKIEPSGRRFTFGVAVGTGFSMSQPAATPFEVQVTAWYNVSRRFSVGAGTGVSCYEKVLIPLFADLRMLLTRPRKFTPYIACSAGYAFAPGRDANGGLYLNPTIGVQYAPRCRLKFFFAAGYGIQNFERLKSYTGNGFTAAYCEQLRHNSLTLKAGVLF